MREKPLKRRGIYRQIRERGPHAYVDRKVARKFVDTERTRR